MIKKQLMKNHLSRRTSLIIGIVGVSAAVVMTSGYTFSKGGPPSETRVIDSFDRYDVGDFPKRFRTYPFQRGKAKSVYRVEEEGGNKYLQAVDKNDTSVLVMREFVWKIKTYPWISWQWRPKQLPPGGDERQRASNDSGCGVYLVFGKYSGRALKYVWSDKAPVGTVVQKDPNKFHIIVQASGPPRDPNAWYTVSVNVPEAYQEQFGEALPKAPTGIGLLTDGNALHVPAACDYDGITVSRNEPLAR